MRIRVADNPPQPAEGSDAGQFKVWIESISLKDGAVIKPAPSGVTAIVGANNTGKTTLLDEVSAGAYGSVYTDAKLAEQVEINGTKSKDDLLAWLTKYATWCREDDNPNGPFFWRGQHAIHPAEIECWGTTPISQATFWTNFFPADSQISSHTSSRIELEEVSTLATQILYTRPDLMKKLSDISEEVFGKPLTLDDESPSHRLLIGRPKIARPSPGEDLGAYRAALNRLEDLDDQGHGMRSWLSLIIQLIVGTWPITIADEPEIFLHPPLARSLGYQLGQLAKETQSQVILATHDRHLLSGLQEGSAAFSVVRLVRTPTRTHAHQLDADKVADLWRDPILRYSDVLDGLFHRAVIVAEAHGDCTFYRAATDHYETTHRGDGDQPNLVKVSDVMFLPTQGKNNIAKFVKALTEVKVPIVVTADFDVLNPDENTLRDIVMALRSAEHWDTTIEPLVKKAREALVRPTDPEPIKEVAKRVQERFDEIQNERPDAVWDDNQKREFADVLKTPSNFSRSLKRKGYSRFSGPDKDRIDRLLLALEEMGIVVVRVGELEMFDSTLSRRDKNRWLQDALAPANSSYASPEAQEHIGRCWRAVHVNEDSL